MGDNEGQSPTTPGEKKQPWKNWAAEDTTTVSKDEKKLWNEWKADPKRPFEKPWLEWSKKYDDPVESQDVVGETFAPSTGAEGG